MGPVRFRDSKAQAWVHTVAAMPANTIDNKEHPDIAFKSFIHQSTDSLYVEEIYYSPRVTGDIHAHGKDEIFYVLEGELIAGGRTLKEGSSMFVKGGTMYNISMGDKGARLLKIQPGFDDKIILRDRRETGKHELFSPG